MLFSLCHENLFLRLGCFFSLGARMVSGAQVQQLAAATDCNANEKVFIVVISTDVRGLFVTVAKLANTSLN